MKAYLTKLFIIIVLSLVASCEPSDDKISGLPGYPSDFQNRAFGGYLNTQSQMRSLHYIFIQSNAGANNSDPVMLWLNGGPGCTSKIGFVQQITPYCLNDTSSYTPQSILQFNKYGWLNLTNLLFIDSPAGVGYSINDDPNYQYSDANTAKDNIFALQYFFSNKFPFYSKSIFYIAGQSYAGKYIPDLAMKIFSQNQKSSDKKINLKGILMANPVISMQGLEESRIQYFIARNFIDPQLIPYYERSCKTDSSSAGCSYFYEKYEDLVYRIDQYNIYGQCYGRKGPPQKSLMAQLSLRMSKFHKLSKRYEQHQSKLQARQWCSYDQGVQRYLKTNADALKSKKIGINIPLCNMTIFNNYKVSPEGSLLQIPALLQKGIKVYIFSGDWDDVVPFTDSYKNLNKMGLRIQGNTIPWLINDNKQHAGFIKRYSYGLNFFLVKGAGHEVPLYQRERSYKVFQKFIIDQ